jgi:hypothetical protein
MNRFSQDCAVLLAVSALLFGCATPKHTSPADSSKSLVSISPSVTKISDQQWNLRVELVYNGDRAIEIDESELPWGFRDSLLLVPVVLNRDRTRLPESYYIDDPTEKSLTLAPGDTLVGTIYLFNRFPDLTAAAATDDVLLLWSYELRPLDGPSLPRVSGGMVIPKQ